MTEKTEDQIRLDWIEKAENTLGENWMGKLAYGLEKDVRTVEKWRAGGLKLPAYAVEIVNLLALLKVYKIESPRSFQGVKFKHPSKPVEEPAV